MWSSQQHPIFSHSASVIPTLPQPTLSTGLETSQDSPKYVQIHR